MQERWSEVWCTNEEKELEGSIPPRGPLSDSLLSLYSVRLSINTQYTCVSMSLAPQEE